MFLAMAQWQLGNREAALQWYDRAVRWMEINSSRDKELDRFRTRPPCYFNCHRPMAMPYQAGMCTIALDDIYNDGAKQIGFLSHSVNSAGL